MPKMPKRLPKKHVLKKTAESLSPEECREIAEQTISLVKALGMLSSTDVSSELVHMFEEMGIDVTAEDEV